MASDCDGLNGLIQFFWKASLAVTKSSRFKVQSNLRRKAPRIPPFERQTKQTSPREKIFGTRSTQGLKNSRELFGRIKIWGKTGRWGQGCRDETREGKTMAKAIYLPSFRV
jgi:hypothetical protein